MTETQNTKPAKATTTRLCNCGCGEQTSSSKTFYRPGHDARHAGMVARDDAASAAEGVERQFSYEDLPTEALRTKARKMAERLVAKAKAPQDRKPSQKAAGKKADKKAADKLTEQEQAAYEARKAAKVQETPTSLADTVAAEEEAHAAALAAEVALRQADIEAQDPGEKIEDAGLLKVGRWTYPARTVDGVLYRNDKRDGSGSWVLA